MPASKPFWLIRRRGVLSLLFGIAAIVAVSIVLASVIQKTRTSAQRMADT